MPSFRHFSRFLGIAAVLAATLADLPAALATVPNTVALEGALFSNGGGPAPDGVYDMVFSLYKDSLGGSAVWIEGPISVGVKNGLFTQTLGTKLPLSAAALANLPTVFAGIKVGGDPELPRQQMHSSPFALRAQVAEGLDCSGCITVGQLDPSLLSGYAKTANLAKVASSGAFGDLTGVPVLAKVASTGAFADLTGAPVLAKVAGTGAFADLTGAPVLAKIATSGAFADITGAPVLATVATSGAYADLKGLPVLAKVGTSCGTGLVVKGIKADGNYDCVAAMDPSTLPADGLNAISNGLLTNQFTDVAASVTVPVAIPDNSPVGVEDSLTVPDLGIAQALTVKIDVANSDTATLAITLTDPDKNVYVLWNKGGPGTGVIATYPKPDKLVSGDLGTWIGKNPKGIWKLKVVDDGFFDNKFDGQIKAWSVNLSTLSNQKVAATGTLVVQGALQLPSAAVPPANCDPAHFGYMYANPADKNVYFCNGKFWFGLPIDAVPTSCKDALKMEPTSKDGVYTIDPDGPFGQPAFKAYCDMTTDGGGWTLVMQVASSGSVDTTLGYQSAYWTNSTLLNETAPTALSNINAKYAPFVTLNASSGKLLLKDKKTGKFTALSVPGFIGVPLLDRFVNLGKTNLTVTAGEASPQALMGFAAVSGMCGSNAAWMLNMLSSHSGIRIGNDVATNSLTTNNQSTWPCYDSGYANLSYSGAGGTLESGKQWQDGYGSEALNRYRDNGGTGQGSHNGVAIFVK